MKVSPWMRYYFPCERRECFGWTISIIILSVITFTLSLIIAYESLSVVETVPPIRGSGSSFASSLYNDWFNNIYTSTGIQASYQNAAISLGYNNLKNSSNQYTFSGGEVNFPEGVQVSYTNTLQFPIVGASLEFPFNIPGSNFRNTHLNISVDVLIEIYNGTITHWNNTKIASLNTVSLPDAEIIPLHYEKQNGATYILSSTFAERSTWWTNNIGVGEKVNFPPTTQSFLPVLDDFDMIETVIQHPYSIGYTLFPVLEQYKKFDFNVSVSTMSMCTQEDQVSGECVNSITLNNDIQKKSLSQYTIQVNGAAIPPNYNWTCEQCWFFNGFTYWYLLEESPYPSGCYPFLSNFQEVLKWIYTDPGAASLAEAENYVLRQGDTYSTLETNLNRLTCAASTSDLFDSAIFVALICLLVFIALFLCILLIRLFIGVSKRYKRLREDPITYSLQGDGPVEITPLLKSAQIDRHEIKLATQIGTGSFGEVFKGVWRGTEVAVKKMMLNSEGQRSVIEDFFQEANLMSTLRHPNVIQFLGASLVQPHLYIVLELAERGSVYDLLGKNDVILDWNKKMNFCIDAAKGMLYLHSSTPPVIHRDLKTANLLVDINWKVKVTDFGLSRVVDTQTTMTHCGTVEFCAPEVLKRSRYTTKADVYSFGICIWQIFTRSALFHNTPLYQLMRMVVHDRYRPPLDDQLFPEKLKDLIERCWAHDQERRPEFGVILKELVDIQANGR